MWEGLDAVDWASLEHNYGSAADVPGLLRRCAGPHGEEAAWELDNLLVHQGGWICSAASAALPFLVRAAAHAGLPGRPVLLGVIAGLAREAGQAADRFVDPGWAPAWEAALPGVLALLDDPEPAVRRSAAHAIGGSAAHAIGGSAAHAIGGSAAHAISGSAAPGERTLPALLRRWGAEDDPATRLDLVLALGAAARTEPAGAHAAEAHRLLRGLLDDPDPQTRLAAVHALAPGEPDLPVRRSDLVLEAVRDPSVQVWSRTATLEAGVQGVHHWTASLLPGPSPAFALGLLADHPDAEQRISGLAQAALLAGRRRSPVAALLPAIVRRLDDPDAEVRFRAAELLACLGPSAAAHADALAGLLGDTAACTSHRGATVGDAALWALARMNDPRCVAGVREQVARGPYGFEPYYAAHFPEEPHIATLPALHEMLSVLPGHARALVPAISLRLHPATDPGLLARLCEVLAGWGDAARGAVPRLLGLLEAEDERTWTAAARALAGIGAVGAGARERLLARADGSLLAAWAYWKAGGAPEPLLRALDGPLPRPAVRMLADLGPPAAAHADRLRALTADGDPWTSVEAAHALWAATGDTESTVPALMAPLRELAEGRYLPVALPAVRCLVRIGRAARPAAGLLRHVPRTDRRLRHSGGWRGFTEDEDIRAAVTALLAS